MERAGKELENEELKRAMRSAGLGTPATRRVSSRHSYVEGLLNVQPKKSERQNVVKNLIAAVSVADLKSAELTGQWEARLSAVAEGREDREAFMSDVKDNLTALISAISTATPPAPERIAADTDEPSLGSARFAGLLFDAVVEYSRVTQDARANFTFSMKSLANQLAQPWSNACCVIEKHNT